MRLIEDLVEVSNRGLHEVIVIIIVVNNETLDTVNDSIRSEDSQEEKSLERLELSVIIGQLRFWLF